MTVFRTPREQGYDILHEVTQFPLIMTTATKGPKTRMLNNDVAVVGKEEDYIRIYRNLVACFETAIPDGGTF